MDDTERRLDALAALGDPVRRRVLRHVLDASAPVSRDEVAAGTGLSRSTAAYHLEKLAGAGLLDVRFQRRTGRRGPGAGRPAKLYLRPATAVAASVPPRAYELLAGLLAEAVAADPSGAAAAALVSAARAAGAALVGGERPDSVLPALAGVGFEPRLADGTIWLRNCPFEPLAGRDPEVVCGAGLALVQGALAAAVGDERRAVLDPAPERCCVVVRAA